MVGFHHRVVRGCGVRPRQALAGRGRRAACARTV